MVILHVYLQRNLEVESPRRHELLYQGSMIFDAIENYARCSLLLIFTIERYAFRPSLNGHQHNP